MRLIPYTWSKNVSTSEAKSILKIHIFFLFGKLHVCEQIINSKFAHDQKNVDKGMAKFLHIGLQMPV